MTIVNTLEQKIQDLPDYWQPFKSKILATKHPIIRYRLNENKPTIWQSKVGGNPYLPRNMAYPTLKGEPLRLLAQINFDDVPHLPNLPQTGLLQFFIDAQLGDYCQVIYHEKLITDSEQLQQDFPTFDDEDFIFLNEGKNEFGMTFELAEQLITVGDKNFSKEIFGVDDFWEDEERFFDKHLKADSMIDFDKLDIFGNQSRHQILGYPFFTQEDPRPYPENAEFKDAILLFQLDSDDYDFGMMWGDSGVGNFFINEKDLKNKDFSNVLFHWDCS